METTSFKEKTDRPHIHLRHRHFVCNPHFITSDLKLIFSRACGASLGAIIFRIKFGSNSDYTFYSLRNTYMSYVFFFSRPYTPTCIFSLLALINLFPSQRHRNERRYHRQLFTRLRLAISTQEICPSRVLLLLLTTLTDETTLANFKIKVHQGVGVYL